MSDQLTDIIQRAVTEAQRSPKSRGMSLAITKLEEAMFWVKYAEDEVVEARGTGRSE